MVFVFIILYLCDCSMNSCLIENLSNNDSTLAIKMTKLDNKTNKIMKMLNTTKIHQGAQGPRGPPGKQGQQGQTGGTYLFGYRPLYNKHTPGLKLTRTSGQGIGAKLYMDKGNFQPQLNWTLTSEGVLKNNFDGNCVRMGGSKGNYQVYMDNNCSSTTDNDIKWSFSNNQISSHSNKNLVLAVTSTPYSKTSNNKPISGNNSRNMKDTSNDPTNIIGLIDLSDNTNSAIDNHIWQPFS